nr:Fic family protein [Luteimonas sp. Y-2-2-4F]
MDEAELALLHKLYEAVLEEEFPDRRITVTDLKHWHRLWLGNVYEWAGRERSVNLGKGGFHFAAAAQVPRLLEAFDRGCLARYTPCHMDETTAIAAIAETHVEFILIHPFREGNGRLSRLLADVMAMQAGYEPLDYSGWDEDKAGYIAAIHAGLAGDYAPMRRHVTQAWRSEQGE